jgi:uncharacterized protein YqgV (UPF0045/DUF77 family)
MAPPGHQEVLDQPAKADRSLALESGQNINSLHTNCDLLVARRRRCYRRRSYSLVLWRAELGTSLAPLPIPKEARMQQRSLSERVEALEKTVAGLQGLPDQLTSMKAQIDAQFTQVAAQFEQVHARFEQLRHEIREGDEETRRQMRILHEDVIARIAALRDGRT